MRLRSDFWVAALLRRCNSLGASAVLRRRGAPEAGAIFVVVDNLGGALQLYGPAPQSELPDGSMDRLFVPLHREASLSSADVESKLARQVSFDPDVWIIEIEDKQARIFFDLANLAGK